MNEIVWSKKALIKLIGVQFKDITDRNWISTWFSWLTNQKERKRQWLHKFTKDQLDEYTADSDNRVYKISRVFNKGSYYNRVANIEKFVYKSCRYVSEKSEYWKTAEETLRQQYGDCDDLNNLIYILCRLVGVPDWMLWNVLGYAGNSYHFYCLLYVRNKGLVPIDATYNVETGDVTKQKKFELGEKYKTVDFIWNEDYIFKCK